ncbi:uncharacterized protein LOC144651064 isoform X1 [Oculina patagonica]
MNNSVSDDLDDTKFLHLDDSSYQNNSAFFSEDFTERLGAWNKTLIHASRQCIELNSVTKENLTINFPVFQAKSVDHKGDFLSLEAVHPVLVRKRSSQDLVNVAYLAILELWPLLVLCFSCAALSGMILWLLDHRSNSEQFPRRFWRGIFDGMWWAIVTMTTVGYGDKSPKSVCARLFATAWMITGIVLLSMFTAQVSSRLTAEELKSEDHLFSRTIGVPPGLYKSDYVDYKMAFSIIKEISDPIESPTDLHVKDLDSIVVFHCNDKEDSNSWEVLQFLPLCEIGASLFLDDELIEFNTEQKFLNCMKTQIRSALNDRKGGQLKHNSKAKESHSCKKLLEQRDHLKFQFKWVYFKNLSQYLIPFGAVLGTILLAFISGAIWDCCRNKKKGKSFRMKDLEDGLTAQTSFMTEKSVEDDK